MEQSRWEPEQSSWEQSSLGPELHNYLEQNSYFRIQKTEDWEQNKKLYCVCAIEKKSLDEKQI